MLGDISRQLQKVLAYPLLYRTRFGFNVLPWHYIQPYSIASLVLLRYVWAVILGAHNSNRRSLFQWHLQHLAVSYTFLS